MVSKGNHPQMAQQFRLAAGVRQIARLWAELFRLVNDCNLPRKGTCEQDKKQNNFTADLGINDRELEKRFQKIMFVDSYRATFGGSM